MRSTTAVLALSLVTQVFLFGSTYNVTSTGYDLSLDTTLAGAIQAANAQAKGSTSTITVNVLSPIMLPASLPPLTPNITSITGSGVTIDGASLYRAFMTLPYADGTAGGTQTISGFTIQNTKATGGAGGFPGGGGGTGAGAALFVGENTTVEIDNMTFNTNTAIGGAGGNSVVPSGTGYGGGGGGGFDGPGGAGGNGPISFGPPSFPQGGGGGGGLLGSVVTTPSGPPTTVSISGGHGDNGAATTNGGGGGGAGIAGSGGAGGSGSGGGGGGIYRLFSPATSSDGALGVASGGNGGLGYNPTAPGSVNGGTGGGAGAARNGQGDASGAGGATYNAGSGLQNGGSFGSSTFGGAGGGGSTGAADVGNGGAGGDYAGGGGSSAQGTFIVTPSVPVSGGQGGLGGGGGGGGDGSVVSGHGSSFGFPGGAGGGTVGYFGGGGAAGFFVGSVPNNGGAGGFGGGSGGSVNTTFGVTSPTGFYNPLTGVQLAYGGAGGGLTNGIGGGGGGSGLGGAIFVSPADQGVKGGVLQIGSSVTFSGNTVTGGAGNGGGVAGTAAGPDIFLPFGGGGGVGSGRAPTIRFTNSAPLDISNVIAGDGVISNFTTTSDIGFVEIVGSAPLTFSTAQTYYSPTVVVGPSSLFLSGSGSITNSLLLELTEAIGASTFDVAGISSGSTDIGSLVSTAANATVNLGSKTLVIHPNIFTSNTPFTGTITGTGGIVIQGNAQYSTNMFTPPSPSPNPLQVFSGNNNYQGGTTLRKGIIGPSSGATVSTTLSITSPTALPSQGPLTLDGATVLDLAFTGSPQISSSLHDGASDPTPAIINLGSAGPLSFLLGSSTPSTFSGTIQDAASGAGSNVVYQGSSKFSLFGTIATTGTNEVSSGELAVLSPGSITHNITVLSGGTLSGTGNIGGTATVQSGGSIRPGGSIGTLSVGVLDLLPGSITLLEIGPTSSSKIVMAGQATLNGELNIIADASNQPFLTNYTIMTAGSGFSGNYVSISQAPNFQYSLVFTDPHTLTLQVVHAPTLSGNNAALANYLIEFAPEATLQLIGAIPFDDVKAALESISPARNAYPTFVTQNMLLGMSEMVQSRLSDRRFLQCDLGCSCDRIDRKESCLGPQPWDIWFDVAEEYTENEPGHQAPDFQTLMQSIFIGGDYFGVDKVDILGGGVGYSHTRMWEDDKQGNAYIEQYYTSAYTMFKYAGCYTDLAVWGSYHLVKNRRNVTFTGFNQSLTANTRGWQFAPHMEFGYDFEKSFFTVEPFAAFDWVNNWEKNFREHGARLLDFRTKRGWSSLLKSEVGLRLYECIESKCANSRFLFKQKIGYVNKAIFGTGETRNKIAGASTYLTLNTFQKDQNLLTAGFDIVIVPRDQNTLYVSFGYNGEYLDSYQSHEGMLKILINF